MRKTKRRKRSRKNKISRRKNKRGGFFNRCPAERATTDPYGYYKTCCQPWKRSKSSTRNAACENIETNNKQNIAINKPKLYQHRCSNMYDDNFIKDCCGTAHWMIPGRSQKCTEAIKAEANKKTWDSEQDQSQEEDVMNENSPLSPEDEVAKIEEMQIMLLRSDDAEANEKVTKINELRKSMSNLRWESNPDFNNFLLAQLIVLSYPDEYTIDQLNSKKQQILRKYRETVNKTLANQTYETVKNAFTNIINQDPDNATSRDFFV
jgi:hypothetical protein